MPIQSQHRRSLAIQPEGAKIAGMSDIPDLVYFPTNSGIARVVGCSPISTAFQNKTFRRSSDHLRVNFGPVEHFRSQVETRAVNPHAPGSSLQGTRRFLAGGSRSDIRSDPCAGICPPVEALLINTCLHPAKTFAQRAPSFFGVEQFLWMLASESGVWSHEPIQNPFLRLERFLTSRFSDDAGD